MAAEPAVAAGANAWGADGYVDIHFYNSVHVSPDGRLVVFEVYKPNIAGEANEWQQQIFLVDMDGKTKALTDMENTGIDHMSPQWSPEGSLISYIALGDGVPNLFVMTKPDSRGRKSRTPRPGL